MTALLYCRQPYCYQVTDQLAWRGQLTRDASSDTGNWCYVTCAQQDSYTSQTLSKHFSSFIDYHTERRSCQCFMQITTMITLPTDLLNRPVWTVSNFVHWNMKSKNVSVGYTIGLHALHYTLFFFSR